MLTSILVPPMFWIPSQLEGAYVGQDVTIECHSEAFPDSINYWVKKDGVMLLLSKSTLSVLIVYSKISTSYWYMHYTKSL